MSLQYLLQVTLTLAVLSAGLYLIMRFANSVQKKKYTGDISILDRRAIDPNVTLMVVSVKSQNYLISVGGKEVKLLKELQ